MKDKYYAVNQDSANYYSNIPECVRDLYTFIPQGSAALDYDNRLVVYKLPKSFGITSNESDLSYDDIYFEFYDNKLYFPDGRVITYHKPEKKTYTITGSDGKRYNVIAWDKYDAEKKLKDYLKSR